jgi:hypothetical protein
MSSEADPNAAAANAAVSGGALTGDMQARLALLQTELTAIETAIRSLDTIGFQIKGWAVTAALAIGGFAITEHKRTLLLVGAAATIGFWLVDCQFKAIQRPFIRRNRALADQLRNSDITGILAGHGKVKVLGVPDIYEGRTDKWAFANIIRYARSIRDAAIAPTVFVLYVFILLAMALEALLLS